MFAVGFPGSVVTEMAFGQVLDGGRMTKCYTGAQLGPITTEISTHSCFWFIELNTIDLFTK